MLYALTPTHKVVALDAATGMRRWTFDSGIAGRGPNRGVMYWTDGERGRLFTGQDTYIYALDAATGELIPEFGTGGRIDLREGLGRDPDRGVDQPHHRQSRIVSGQIPPPIVNEAKLAALRFVQDAGGVRGDA